MSENLDLNRTVEEIPEASSPFRVVFHCTRESVTKEGVCFCMVAQWIHITHFPLRNPRHNKGGGLLSPLPTSGRYGRQHLNLWKRETEARTDCWSRLPVIANWNLWTTSLCSWTRTASFEFNVTLGVRLEFLSQVCLLLALGFGQAPWASDSSFVKERKKIISISWDYEVNICVYMYMCVYVYMCVYKYIQFLVHTYPFSK